jgi:hypothetical protein
MLRKDEGKSLKILACLEFKKRIDEGDVRAAPGDNGKQCYRSTVSKGDLS